MRNRYMFLSGFCVGCAVYLGLVLAHLQEFRIGIGEIILEQGDHYLSALIGVILGASFSVMMLGFLGGSCFWLWLSDEGAPNHENN